jgi:hypothetical protein
MRVIPDPPIRLGGPIVGPSFDAEPATTDPTTQRMCDETGHHCIACPSDVRNIGAVLHNLVGALESAQQDGDFFRVWKKLPDARRAVDGWRLVVEGHFAAMDAWRRP